MAKKKDDDRIRDEAHKLWEAEGRPDGRADRHWTEAREIVALKDSAGTALKPVEETLEEPAEPALAAENLGDLPGLTDQGDEVLAPSLDAAAAVADEAPLVTDEQEAAEAAKPARKAAEPAPKTAAGAKAEKADKKAAPAKKPAKTAEKAAAKPAAKGGDAKSSKRKTKGA